MRFQKIWRKARIVHIVVLVVPGLGADVQHSVAHVSDKLIGMPITSYLAYPFEGQREELSVQLSRLKGCEVLAATNEQLLILVTDTRTSLEEEELWRELQSLPALERLDLVFGHLEPAKDSSLPTARNIEIKKEAGWSTVASF